MPLPFPHGSAPGQIANGSFYDVNDTPRSVGGRFVGFAEYGTSAVTNRAAWALSSNIDYIYQKYSSALAVPQVDKYISTGTSSYQLSTLVFCGDGTYPPSHDAAEGLMVLFAVLDEQYNALTDAAGNEVRVSRVMDPTDTDSVYGTGFVQSPWVHFCTVNPKTGELVLDPYEIPADQVVRFSYGVASSLESLPVDALTRFKVMSGEEVPAGVLLLDGTLPMAGELSMGDNGISSIDSLSGYEGAPITIASNLNGASSVALVGFTGIQNVGDGSIPVNAIDGFASSGSGLYEFGTLTLVPPNSMTDLFGVTWQDASSGTWAFVQFLSNPGTYPKLKFDLYDPISDLEYQLLLDAETASFNPSTGAQLDLGLDTNPWNNLWAINLKTSTISAAFSSPSIEIDGDLDLVSNNILNVTSITNSSGGGIIDFGGSSLTGLSDIVGVLDGASYDAIGVWGNLDGGAAYALHGFSSIDANDDSGDINGLIVASPIVLWYDQVTVDLGTAAWSYTLTEPAVDYVFPLDDFGQLLYSAINPGKPSPGENVGDWLTIQTTSVYPATAEDGFWVSNGTIDPTLVGDRFTTIEVGWHLQGVDATSNIFLQGPLISNPITNLVSAKFAFNLPVVSDLVHNIYAAKFGFNSTAYAAIDGVPELVACEIVFAIDTTGVFTASVKDGTHTWTSGGIGPVQANTFYDCQIYIDSDGFAHFVVVGGILNHHEISDTPIAYTGPLYFLPVFVYHTACTGGYAATADCAVLLDYAEVHTNGHLPRSTSPVIPS